MGRTDTNTGVDDFDDGFGRLAHVRELHDGDVRWQQRCEAYSHCCKIMSGCSNSRACRYVRTFGDDTQGTFRTDEQLRRVKAGRRLVCATSSLDDLSGRKNDGLLIERHNTLARNSPVIESEKTYRVKEPFCFGGSVPNGIRWRST